MKTTEARLDLIDILAGAVARSQSRFAHRMGPASWSRRGVLRVQCLRPGCGFRASVEHTADGCLLRTGGSLPCRGDLTVEVRA